MELLLDSFIGVLTVRVLFLILAGTLVGILVGALPGINAPTGIALAIPMTFTVTPAEGLILLGTIYGSSIYGGSISAVLMNVPGEPADVVTTFDGYPMAKRGEPQRALELAAISSAFGGVMGCLALLFLSPPLARIALLFGPVEIFWVAIFGMTVIGAVSKGNIFNGLLGGAFGMLLATVGVNPVTGVSRFTFGSSYLVSGIDIVSALIGLFAMSEMLNSFQESTAGSGEIVRLRMRRGAIWHHLREFFSYPFAYLLSSAVGIIVGIIPAAGPSIGALISYSEVKRRSRNRSQFGQGAPDGIIAADTGKNAVVGGSIIPLLTLGVPGSPAAAILLGGLIIHGLFPGQGLFTTHAHVTYTFMVGMVLAQLMMLIVGVAGSRLWGQATRIPIPYLTPTIIALCVIGSYATRNNPTDVLTMTGIGFGMYLAAKVGFQPAPVVIGLVLGDLAENGFLLGRILGEAAGSVWAYFFLRPIPMIMIGLTLASLAFTVIAQRRERREARAKAQDAMTSTSASRGSGAIREYHVNIVVGFLAILFAFWAEHQLRGHQPENIVFPIVLLWIFKGVGVVMIGQEILFGRRYNLRPVFGGFHPVLPVLIALTLGYVVAALFAGYYVSTFVYFLLVPLILGKKDILRLLTRALPIALGMSLLLYWLFYRVLDVRMPTSLLF